MTLLRVVLLSHSVWSAWIEIGIPLDFSQGGSRRTPYGVRGLKLIIRIQPWCYSNVALRMESVD
ncbi:hypothetical protein [Paenibacillus sp. UASWS1643]|uniref:hypothetical protein n=1 Tax=Paenibacillus sp. UASWS1643 TaxID=2580422 RepID=UPI00398BE5DB